MLFCKVLLCCCLSEQEKEDIAGLIEQVSFLPFLYFLGVVSSSSKGNKVFHYDLHDHLNAFVLGVSIKLGGKYEWL